MFKHGRAGSNQLNWQSFGSLTSEQFYLNPVAIRIGVNVPKPSFCFPPKGTRPFLLWAFVGDHPHELSFAVVRIQEEEINFHQKSNSKKKKNAVECSMCCCLAATLHSMEAVLTRTMSLSLWQRSNATHIRPITVLNVPGGILLNSLSAKNNFPCSSLGARQASP